MTDWLVVVPLIEEPEATAEALAMHDVKPNQLMYVDNTPDGAYAGFADRALVRNSTGENWGVSRSWNAGLQQGRDWTLILSSSVVLPRGLRHALSQFDEVIEDGEKWCVFTTEAMHCFAVSRELIREIGGFDEKFFPGYFEDDDFLYRLRLFVGLDRPKVELGANSYTDACIARALKRGLVQVDFGELKAYYVRKWNGPPGEEKFTTPFER